MSFLDEPDEPVRRPRRRPGAGPGVDRQTMVVRQSIAVAGTVLVLILLVVGVRGCLGARQDRSLKDYVRDVAALTEESSQQSAAVFRLLNGPGGRDQAVNVENSLNGFRVQSAQLVDRARDLDHPGDVGGAQDELLDVLEFRRDGLAKIADSLPTALGDQDRREGTEDVTAQMQTFLTSDVIYTQRFVPRLQAALKDRELDAEVRIPRSQFVPDIQWLQPRFVSQKVSGIRTGGGGDAAPGLHGNGLGTVTLGGQALNAGGAATSVKVSGDLSFEVQVANQGENTETDVAVTVKIGKGDDAIDLEEPLDSIAAGETKTVSVGFQEKPPTGQNVPVEVAVGAVPGEEKTDNNKATYSVIFTR